MAGEDSILADVMKAASAQAEPAEPAEVAEPVAAEPSEPVEVAPVEEAQQAEATAKADRARDAVGKFTKAPKVAPKPSVTPVTKPAPSGTDGKAPAVSPAVSGAAPSSSAEVKPSELRAPQNWKPQAREKWAALPREVQEEAVRVHREAQTALNDSATARKFHEEFRQTLAPYAPILGGQDPVKAVDGLLRSVHVLHSGPPAHKAQLVAQMIQNYGVDIPMLAKVLDGQAPTQQPGAIDPDAIVAQAEQRMMQRLQAQQQQATQSRAHQELEAFKASGKAEFFDDVQAEMGSLLRAGLAKNFEEAYNAAVKLNPNVWSTIQQREDAKRATASQAATTRSRAASTSLRSEPTGPVAPTGKRSILDEVKAQASKLSGSTGR